MAEEAALCVLLMRMNVAIVVPGAVQPHLLCECVPWRTEIAIVKPQLVQNLKVLHAVSASVPFCRSTELPAWRILHYSSSSHECRRNRLPTTRSLAPSFSGMALGGEALHVHVWGNEPTPNAIFGRRPRKFHPHQRAANLFVVPSSSYPAAHSTKTQSIDAAHRPFRSRQVLCWH